MGQSRLSTGMNIAVATTTTVETLRKQFEEALVKRIVETSKTFGTVKHKVFKDIFTVANRRITVRTRTTFQRQVLKIADSLQIALKRFF